MQNAPQYLPGPVAPRKRGKKMGKKLAEVEAEFCALAPAECTEATFLALARCKSINEEKARKHFAMFLKGLEVGKRGR